MGGRQIWKSHKRCIREDTVNNQQIINITDVVDIYTFKQVLIYLVVNGVCRCKHHLTEYLWLAML